MIVLERILSTIRGAAESGKDASSGDGDQMFASLVLPDSAAVTVIGRGGATINELTRVSGAGLQFSERNFNSNQQRVLKVTGQYDAVRGACMEVLSLTQSD